MAERMTLRHNGKVYFDNVMFSKNDALRKLAEYEETGLSPYDVLQLIEDVKQLRARAIDSVEKPLENKKKGWLFRS